MNLILASASPRRLELLSGLIGEFSVVASKAEELHDEALGASELCEINARRKAQEVSQRNPDALVIGADTLVALGSRIFGKPQDLLEAKRMLQELSGKTHDVVTGVCLVQSVNRKLSVFHELTRVTFKLLKDPEIDAYLKAVHVLDKAGAYGIQEHGEMIVEDVDGSFNNVVGLPTERLARELNTWGIQIEGQRERSR